MDPVELLLAIEQIKAVKARYCRLMDTKDWEGWGQLFTETATMNVGDDVNESIGTPVVSGRAAIVEMVHGFVHTALTTHHVHSPEISFTSDTSADVIWAMQDRVVWARGDAPMPVRALTGYGHYHERYLLEGGVWRIDFLALKRLNLEFEPLPV